MYEIRMYDRAGKVLKAMTIPTIGRALRLAEAASQMRIVASAIVQDVEGLDDPVVYENGWEVD